MSIIGETEGARVYGNTLLSFQFFCNHKNALKIVYYLKKIRVSRKSLDLTYFLP